jgi:RHS repeat-associated protein
MSSTPAGGGTPTVTSYVWCEEAICQARDGSGSPIRAYLDEGEYVPGVTPQKLFYGIDQLGSVRRVFASTGSTPAYDYDPYGNPLQGTAPLTDLGYAGMWTNGDSGLNLTHYRAYNPTAGRWLSRDPLGEGSDEGANLYAYVGGDPVNLIDPLGLQRAIPRPWGIPFPIPGTLGPDKNGNGVSDWTESAVKSLDDLLCSLNPFCKKSDWVCYDDPPEDAGNPPSSEMAGHRKKRPSTEGKHEEADARRGQDYGGEKGDASRRPPRRPPGGKTPPGGWPPKN